MSESRTLDLRNRLELTYQDGSVRTILTDLTAIEVMKHDLDVVSVLVGSGDDRLRIDRNQTNLGERA